MLKKLTLVVVLAFSGSAFAAGDAGCGLGSMIIQKNAKLSQLFALTTNATFFSQAFGITSGTSNCSASGFVKAEQEAKYYAEANMPNLKVDMARGQGENLVAFAQILGCNDQAIPAFNEMVQSNYSAIFPSESVSADQVVKSIRTQMGHNTVVNSGCTPSI